MEGHAARAARAAVVKECGVPHPRAVAHSAADPHVGIVGHQVVAGYARDVARCRAHARNVLAVGTAATRGGSRHALRAWTQKLLAVQGIWAEEFGQKLPAAQRPGGREADPAAQ